jgi:hypothetical protein
MGRIWPELAQASPHQSGLEHTNTSRCSMGHVGKHDEHDGDEQQRQLTDYCKHKRPLMQTWDIINIGK